MLHVKCNCRFERRGGDDRLMDSLIHGRLHLEEKASKSQHFGIVTRGVISGEDEAAQPPNTVNF